jgi:hypothetical protein
MSPKGVRRASLIGVLSPARDLGATSSVVPLLLLCGAGPVIMFWFASRSTPTDVPGVLCLLRARRNPSPGFLCPAPAVAAAPQLRKWLSTGLFGWLQSGAYTRSHFRST